MKTLCVFFKYLANLSSAAIDLRFIFFYFTENLVVFCPELIYLLFLLISEI